jgi:hypothetical protein
MTTALEGGEESASSPGRCLPPGKTRYPLYRRLGGTQGRFGQVRKISPPPGFDPPTLQPVGSGYTDYATRPTINVVPSAKKLHSYATCIRMRRPLQQEFCRNPHMFLSVPPLPQEKNFRLLGFYLSLSEDNVITWNDEPNINVV